MGRFAPLAVAAVLPALAAGLAVPALAATPGPGKWRGKTAQGLRVSFKVNARGPQVRRFKVGVRFDCEEGADRTTRKLTRFTVRRGRFRILADRSRYDKLRLRGRFTKKGRVRGRFRITETNLDDGECDSGWVRFRARRR